MFSVVSPPTSCLASCLAARFVAGCALHSSLHSPASAWRSGEDRALPPVVYSCERAGRLTSFGGRFTSQVFPGDDLTATATVDEVRDENGSPIVLLSVRTANQDDREVFSGYATARIDP